MLSRFARYISDSEILLYFPLDKRRENKITNEILNKYKVKHSSFVINFRKAKNLTACNLCICGSGLKYYLFSSERASSNAFANWSGQDVFLNPHSVPLSFSITSEAFIPSDSFATPWVLPLQPLINWTFLTIPFSISKLI